jgi:hypothetical protein
VSAREFVEAVGRDTVIRRLGGLVTRLDGLRAELDANAREYGELQRAYRIARAEHEQLTAKLRALESESTA